MLRLNFHPKHKDAKIFENHLFANFKDLSIVQYNVSYILLYELPYKPNFFRISEPVSYNNFGPEKIFTEIPIWEIFG